MRSQRGCWVEYPSQNSNFIEGKSRRTCIARSGSNGGKELGRYVGRVSCLGLVALGFMLVNPVARLEARAVEESSDGADDAAAVSDESDMNNENSDVGIMPAALFDSAVAIAFTPTSANGTVTPVDATGAKAKVDVKATIYVQNSGGYKVYLGSNSSQLKNGANAIDSVTSATAYDNLPVNSWGYSFAKGETTANSYVGMPATLRSAPLDSNSNTNIGYESRTYMLSFAANVGADKPAGVYKNQVTMSVVSSPVDVAGFSVDTLQAMTPTVCANAGVGAEKQLRDTRDGKYYWVSKLADGKCWMTQDLALDLSTSKALTPADSDVRNNWTSKIATATVVNADTINSDPNNTETRSWNLGNYRLAYPTERLDCASGKNNLSQCVDIENEPTKKRLIAYDVPETANNDKNAHYAIGNYYSWYAAVAGTGEILTEGGGRRFYLP